MKKWKAQKRWRSCNCGCEEVLKENFCPEVHDQNGKLHNQFMRHHHRMPGTEENN